MLRDLFKPKKRYTTVKVYPKKERESDDAKMKEISDRESMLKQCTFIDSDKIWMKCSGCGEIILTKDFKDNNKVCSKCGNYGRLSANERLESIVDKKSFLEYDTDIETYNVLGFPDYDSKLEIAKEQSGLKEAVITGEAKIKGKKCGIGIMDSNFMMGSMGSVVGEKITRLIEKSIERRNPVIIFTASGGARMQEGTMSLMQMAKTSSALARLDDEKLLYISILTDPTTGGVTASFAMLGDLILAEPKALIGFAGPRVIEQTIKQKLPDGFQKSEFLLDKGFVDKIVKREDMRETLSNILEIHSLGGERDE